MKDKLFSSTTNKEQVPNLGGEELNVKAVIQNSGYQTFDFSSKNKRTAFATRVKVGSRVGLLYAGDRTVQYYTIVKDEYSIVPKFASGASRNKLLAEKKSKGSDINNNEITEISPTAKAVMGKAVAEL